MTIKEINNILQITSNHPNKLKLLNICDTMTNNAFYVQFKSTSLSLFGIPIRVELYERKMTLRAFILLLKSKGFIYDYYLLKVVLDGKANNHFNLYYFTHLYDVLSLPFPSADYLHKSHLRWQEIKQFKKEQLNISKIKRGLSPIP
jgi:hypothetical protein